MLHITKLKLIKDRVDIDCNEFMPNFWSTSGYYIFKIVSYQRVAKDYRHTIFIEKNFLSEAYYNCIAFFIYRGSQNPSRMNSFNHNAEFIMDSFFLKRDC